MRSDFSNYDPSLLKAYSQERTTAVTGIVMCGDSTYGARTMSYAIYIYGNEITEALGTPQKEMKCFYTGQL